MLSSNFAHNKMETDMFSMKLEGGYVNWANSVLLALAIAAAFVLLGGGAAIAGADTTFAPALTTFTNFLEGSGGAVITVLALVGGIIGMASGRFSLGQVALPVGVGIAVGTGVPIVTSTVTAIV